jgi:hypothetical protein
LEEKKRAITRMSTNQPVTGAVPNRQHIASPYRYDEEPGSTAGKLTINENKPNQISLQLHNKLDQSSQQPVWQVQSNPVIEVRPGQPDGPVTVFDQSPVYWLKTKSAGANPVETTVKAASLNGPNATCKVKRTFTQLSFDYMGRDNKPYKKYANAIFTSDGRMLRTTFVDGKNVAIEFDFTADGQFRSENEFKGKTNGLGTAKQLLTDSAAENVNAFFNDLALQGGRETALAMVGLGNGPNYKPNAATNPPVDGQQQTTRHTSPGDVIVPTEEPPVSGDNALHIRSLDAGNKDCETKGKDPIQGDAGGSSGSCATDPKMDKQDCDRSYDRGYRHGWKDRSEQELENSPYGNDRFQPVPPRPIRPDKGWDSYQHEDYHKQYGRDRGPSSQGNRRQGRYFYSQSGDQQGQGYRQSSHNPMMVNPTTTDSREYTIQVGNPPVATIDMNLGRQVRNATIDIELAPNYGPNYRQNYHNF